MEYMTLLAQEKNIAIIRVENGWLIRTNDGVNMGCAATPLKVAETAESLVELVAEWARQSDSTE